jgi:hypothetical protein
MLLLLILVVRRNAFYLFFSSINKIEKVTILLLFFTDSEHQQFLDVNLRKVKNINAFPIDFLVYIKNIGLRKRSLFNYESVFFHFLPSNETLFFLLFFLFLNKKKQHLHKEVTYLKRWQPETRVVRCCLSSIAAIFIPYAMQKYFQLKKYLKEITKWKNIV